MRRAFGGRKPSTAPAAAQETPLTPPYGGHQPSSAAAAPAGSASIPSRINPFHGSSLGSAAVAMPNHGPGPPAFGLPSQKGGGQYPNNHSSSHSQRTLPDPSPPSEHDGTAASSSSSSSVVWTAQAVAQLPPPGLSGPTQPVFAPGSGRYLAFVSSASQSTRAVKCPPSLYRPLTGPAAAAAPPTASNNGSSSISGPTFSRSMFSSPQGRPSSSSASPSSTSAATPPTTPGGSSSSSSAERMLMCLDVEQLSASGRGGNSTAAVAGQPASPARPLLRLGGPGGAGGSRRGDEAAAAPPTPSSSGDPVAGRVAAKRRFDSQQPGGGGGGGAGGGASSGGGGGDASSSSTGDDLEERLRRERQRLSMGTTQFHWAWTATTTTTGTSSDTSGEGENPPSRLRVLLPVRGSLLVQDGVLDQAPSSLSATTTAAARVIHEQSKSPIDPQLSPDGTMVAWSCDGEIYVKSATAVAATPAIQVTHGANPAEGLSHGVAEFVAQEEMDRYRGFWWHPSSTGILFAKVDESSVPVYRIVHHQHSASISIPISSPGASNSSSHGDASASGEAEDHRYPFAGKVNPVVRLGFVQVDQASVVKAGSVSAARAAPIVITEPSCLETALLEAAASMNPHGLAPQPSSEDAAELARARWNSQVIWFDPPREASEYLCRVYWLEDENCLSVWQNRAQTALVLQRMDLASGKGRTLLVERSEKWVNLHHMFCLLPPIHPTQCALDDRSSAPSPSRAFASPANIPLPAELPPGTFSFLFASERTGYSHLYLYTYVPGVNGEQAVQLRAVSSGEWMVEQIVGADAAADWVYVTGTLDGPLERHLYALPITGRPRSPTIGLKQPPGGAEAPDAVMTMSDSAKSTSSSVNSMSCDESTTVTPSHSQDIPAASSTPNGVRRSLSKVMHALSGKSLMHQDAKVESLRSSTGTVNSLHRQRTRDGAPSSDEFSAVSTSAAVVGPVRLTHESGMHSIVMDDTCRYFVDTSSDLDRPTSVRIYEIDGQHVGLAPPKLVLDLFDAVREDTALARLSGSQATTSAVGSGPYASISTRVAYGSLPSPEVITFPTSDGTETLHGALYRPDPRMYGPGPYPLVCAVYGGPHVQRVNRSWSQCADMRAQRLRSLGFCVVKCDNRGSSRRGTAFETAVYRRLGRIEVLDQVAAVRQLVMRGIADPNRVGVYGWSYGGYLAAMCLCRAPDVFHVAVAGAPVTSWDGYDTHYTERYMGLPSDNAVGYRESSVFEHVPNMRGRLLLVHGLIDENVHFRHTARLINKLIAAGKDYELLLFPDERHSPRRLRDRVYMEQRVSDFFQRHLTAPAVGNALGNVDLVDVASQGGLQGLRAMAGRL